MANGNGKEEMMANGRTEAPREEIEKMVEAEMPEPEIEAEVEKETIKEDVAEKIAERAEGPGRLSRFTTWAKKKVEGPGKLTDEEAEKLGHEYKLAKTKADYDRQLKLAEKRLKEDLKASKEGKTKGKLGTLASGDFATPKMDIGIGTARRNGVDLNVYKGNVSPTLQFRGGAVSPVVQPRGPSAMTLGIPKIGTGLAFKGPKIKMLELAEPKLKHGKRHGSIEGLDIVMPSFGKVKTNGNGNGKKKKRKHYDVEGLDHIIPKYLTERFGL